MASFYAALRTGPAELVAAGPLAPQQTVILRILRLAIEEVTLAQQALALESLLHQKLDGRSIPRIRVGLDPMQSELLEGESNQQRHGLGRVAAAPVRAANRKANLASPMLVVDLK